MLIVWDVSVVLDCSVVGVCPSVTIVRSVLSNLIVTILGTSTNVVHVPRISIVLSILSVLIVLNVHPVLSVSSVLIVLIIIILILISSGWVKTRLRSGPIVLIIPGAIVTAAYAKFRGS